jgi:hypothetical protein
MAKKMSKMRSVGKAGAGKFPGRAHTDPGMREKALKQTFGKEGRGRSRFGSTEGSDCNYTEPEAAREA